MQEVFHRFATRVSAIVGSSYSFIAAIFIILVWLLTGPVFGFSTTWQLVINTLTTITTFLIVFLIQNTQNRDAKATQLKLDELIKGVKGARTSFVDLEELSDAELEKLQEEFRDLHEKYNAELQRRKAKTTP